MSSDKSVPGQIRTMAEDIKKARLIREGGEVRPGAEAGSASSAGREAGWQISKTRPGLRQSYGEARPTTLPPQEKAAITSQTPEKQTATPETTSLRQGYAGQAPKPQRHPLAFWAKNLPLGSFGYKKVQAPPTPIPAPLVQEKETKHYRAQEDLVKLLPIEPVLAPRPVLRAAEGPKLAEKLPIKQQGAGISTKQAPFAKHMTPPRTDDNLMPPPPSHLPGAATEEMMPTQEPVTPALAPLAQRGETGERTNLNVQNDEQDEAPRETPEDILGIGKKRENIDEKGTPETAPHFPLNVPEEEEEVMRPRTEQIPLAAEERLEPRQEPARRDEEGQQTGEYAGQRKPLPRSAKFLIATVGVLAGIFVIGFIYWGIFIKNNPPAAPRPDGNIPAVEDITSPKPLLAIDAEVTLRFETGESKTSLLGRVRALENFQQDPDTLVAVDIYDDSKKGFANTADFLSYLSFRMPESIRQSLEETPMLYLYTPATEEKEKCTEGAVIEASCFSPRLGVVFPIKAGVTQEELKNALALWEETLVADFASLILGNPRLPENIAFASATYGGKDITYKATLPVRFINLPISTTALNYAVADGFLVLATSKNSLYEALDRIVQADERR